MQNAPGMSCSGGRACCPEQNHCTRLQALHTSVLPQCLAWVYSCWHACGKEGRRTGAGSWSEVTQLSPIGKVVAGPAKVLQEPTGWKKLLRLSGTDHKSQLYSIIWFLAQISVGNVFQREGEGAARDAAWGVPTQVHQMRGRTPMAAVPLHSPKMCSKRANTK